MRTGKHIDIRGRDLSGSVRAMQRAVAEGVKLPPGYYVAWSGQWENQTENDDGLLKLIVDACVGPG